MFPSLAGNGTSTTFDLGLPSSDVLERAASPESDGESGDGDSDADGAAGSVRSKGSSRPPRIPDMEKEHVFEALCLFMVASAPRHIVLYRQSYLRYPSNASWPRPSKMYPLS